MGGWDGPVRDLSSFDLPGWGRVVPGDELLPWRVEDDAGRLVGPIADYLRDVVARGCSAWTVRSYAYALHRWWKFLAAWDVRWDMATSAETRDFVLWLQRAEKPVAARRAGSAGTAGTINMITRKRYQDDQYKPATIRQSNAVLRSFYEFWLERGSGPLVNPVPLDRPRRGRPNAHHNPLEPFRPQGRLRYNPPSPRRRPRAVPDHLWDSLFASMPSDRDRAILALDISNGARASELLGMRGSDIDWGEQLIQVCRKGSRELQWLPASGDAFVWLRLYLAAVGEPGPADPVWVTLRRRSRDGKRPQRQPLTYDAWRAVLRRANGRLGTNWSMHDLRHTAAIRMIRDENLTLRDVQVILGHASLTTTQIYLEEDSDQVIMRVRDHLAGQADRARIPAQVAAGYDAGDLAVLFGTGAPR